MDNRVRIQLVELIQVSSFHVDAGHKLSISDLEQALLNKELVAFLKRDQPDFVNNTSLSMLTEEPSQLNELLYGWWIGEYNSAQPGKSARKWGINNNGFCLLISLCAECMNHED